ncbi:MlaD family protein [Henriciella marina]|uniref:MlaD family protein n=1 Tax=Henriciella marina TaxID=453851 RepID=UPI000364C948|nr:MlaD family protein [Henriciella marina]
MRESILETIIGTMVLGVAGFFLWFAIGNGADQAQAAEGSVELGARFNSVSGVERGTDVRMAGVKVGTVRGIELNVERAEALVTMAVDQKLVPLDDGTTARIQSEGLLGGNYINLEPAAGFGQIEACSDGEELFGESGCGEILYTQGSVDLLTLMASFANNSGGDDSEASSDAGSSAPEPTAGTSRASPQQDADTDTESPESDASVDETDEEAAGDDQ